MLKNNKNSNKLSDLADVSSSKLSSSELTQLSYTKEEIDNILAEVEKSTAVKYCANDASQSTALGVGEIGYDASTRISLRRNLFWSSNDWLGWRLQ